MSFHRRLRIAAAPPSEREAHARLLETLEALYPVRFEARSENELADVDAVLFLRQPTSIDPLVLPVPAFVTCAAAGHSVVTPVVEMSQSPPVDRALRGRRLSDVDVAVEGVRTDPGSTVLATVASRPVWAIGVASRVHRVAAPLAELPPDRPLRDALRPGRFLALTALTHFLDGLCSEVSWHRPDLRAAFVFDDPNLHWPSYGYLRYEELACLAARDDYHVAIATVPLDAWFAHPRTVKILRESIGRMSLLVHGNDHVSDELGRRRSVEAARAVAAQALRRVRGLESRTGLPVSRVMAPPHNVCSREMMRALAVEGFDALCYSPWRDDDWQAPLDGWLPGDTGEGLFVIRRRRIEYLDDELVFTAYLRRPLVVHAHHQDLRAGLGVLADAARQLTALGDVRWCSLGEIAASNFDWRTDSETFRVRPYSRRLRIEVPEGVCDLVCEPPPSYRPEDGETVLVQRRGQPAPTRTAFFEPVPVSPGEAVEVRLSAASAAPAPLRRATLWPLARRGLVEARDRMMPTVDRLRQHG